MLKQLAAKVAGEPSREHGCGSLVACYEHGHQVVPQLLARFLQRAKACQIPARFNGFSMAHKDAAACSLHAQGVC